MNPEYKLNLSDVVVYFDGQAIGNIDGITAVVELHNDNELDNDISWNKQYEAILSVEYIDEKFLDSLGLYEYQKTLIRQELRKRQLAKNKSKKKLSMRESMNNHIKHGKKW